jgi:fluoroacetyl-CoA thioesterase
LTLVSVKSGVHGEVEHVVSEGDTAASLHCGDVPVLGTPRVVSLCEEATIEALADLLAPGQTSVGTRVEVAHLAPVAIGSTVRASATLERSEGRRLIFSVSVTDHCGLVAAGKVTRVVVDRAHFIEKAR